MHLGLGTGSSSESVFLLCDERVAGDVLELVRNGEAQGQQTHWVLHNGYCVHMGGAAFLLELIILHPGMRLGLAALSQWLSEAVPEVVVLHARPAISHT